MVTALLIGSLFGGTVGLAHAGYVFKSLATPQSPARHTAGRARAVYFSLWTFALWVLFGTYVLSLWLLAIALRAIGRGVAKWCARAG